MPLGSPPELWGIWSLWRRQQARGPWRVENPGNRAPASPANTSLGGPKWGGISGTMLFIFLFLNKSEVSGGTNEVIRKDMSGIKPPASRPRGALGTRTLEKLRGGLFILDSVTQAWAQGAGQTCPQALHSLFPWVPPGNSGASNTLKMVPSVSPAAGWEDAPLWKEIQIHFSPSPHKCSSQKQKARWGECPHGAQSQPSSCHQLALLPDGPSTCPRVYALPPAAGLATLPRLLGACHRERH